MSKYTNDRIYTIYMHIFPDDKVYIGMTRQKMARRWRSDGSGYVGQPQVWDAIEKFGWENVQHEIIATCLTRYEAEHMERNLVELYKANDVDHGYNIDYGGQGVGRVAQRTKDKLSEINTGRIPTDEQRLHMSIAQTGRHHPDEVKRKISESNKGKKMSDEAKRKLSETGKRNPACRENLKKAVEANCKPILRYSVDTGEFIARYESSVEACKEFTFTSSLISAAAKGKKNQIAGSVWVFESEATQELIERKLNKARKKAKIYRNCAETDEEGSVLRVFVSITDAAKANDKHRCSVQSWIDHHTASPSGHYFTLISKEDFTHYSSLGLLYTPTKEP